MGENVAGRVAAGGLRTVLVERELVGGECSYWACMPSKALLRPTQAIAEAQRVAGASQAVTGTVDVAAVLARRDEVTHGWDDSSQVDWVRSAGIDLVRGRARVTGERTVEVTSDDGTVTLRAEVAVVVCTGSEPSAPDLPGLADVATWSSRDATSAQAVPESLCVLGGGVVGVEMAQAYSRLGSRVTLVSRGRLLARAEPRAAELVATALQQDGVALHQHTEVASVAADGDDGAAVVELADGTSVRADRLLVATGRRPATGGLGLEQWGVAAGEPVRGRRHGPGGGHHLALRRGRRHRPRAAHPPGQVRRRAPSAPPCWPGTAATSVRTRCRSAGRPRSPPRTPGRSRRWCSPTRRSPGSGQASRRRGRATRTCGWWSTTSRTWPGASVHDDEYTGWAQMLVDESRQVVVGVTFVGPDVAELLHSATVAVVGEVPLHRLWHAVPSYPTTSEVWLRLLETYGL